MNEKLNAILNEASMSVATAARPEQYTLDALLGEGFDDSNVDGTLYGLRVKTRTLYTDLEQSKDGVFSGMHIEYFDGKPFALTYIHGRIEDASKYQTDLYVLDNTIIPLFREFVISATYSRPKPPSAVALPEDVIDEMYARFVG